MKIVDDIMKLLKCSEQWAKEVRDHMEEWFDIDYSNCSTLEFNACVRGSEVQLAGKRLRA